MKFIIASFLLALVPLTLFPRDITTLSGTTYNNATVLESDDTKLTISYKDATARNILKSIPFTDLPNDIRKEFNYDPQKVEAQRQEQLKKQEDAKQAEALRQKAAADAKRKNGVVIEGLDFRDMELCKIDELDKEGKVRSFHLLLKHSEGEKEYSFFSFPALNIVMRDGTVYEKVKLSNINPIGVIVTSKFVKKGSAYLKFADMSPGYQSFFSYTPQKEADYINKEKQKRDTIRTAEKADYEAKKAFGYQKDEKGVIHDGWGNVMVNCPTCSGKGERTYTDMNNVAKTVKCGFCGGKGLVQENIVAGGKDLAIGDSAKEEIFDFKDLKQPENAPPESKPEEIWDLGGSPSMTDLQKRKWAIKQGQFICPDDLFFKIFNKDKNNDAVISYDEKTISNSGLDPLTNCYKFSVNVKYRTEGGFERWDTWKYYIKDRKNSFRVKIGDKVYSTYSQFAAPRSETSGFMPEVDWEHPKLLK